MRHAIQMKLTAARQNNKPRRASGKQNAPVEKLRPGRILSDGAKKSIFAPQT
jgi:hypothetical protein